MIPEGIRAFFAEDALTLDGRAFDGAPFGRRGGRVETSPAPGGAADWYPLLEAGDVTLLVDARPPHRVVVDGDACEEVVPRLVDLEPLLLPRLRQLEDFAEAPRERLRNEDHAGARALLEPVLRAVELLFEDHDNWLTLHQQHVIADFENMMGLCEQYEGDTASAEARWRRVVHHSGPACRNLCELFLKRGNAEALASLAEDRFVAIHRDRHAFVLTALAIVRHRAKLDVDEVVRRLSARAPWGVETVELIARHPEIDSLLRGG